MCEWDEDVTLVFLNYLTDAPIALNPHIGGLLSYYYSMLNCAVCTVAVRRAHAGMANLPNSQHDYMLSVPGPNHWQARSWQPDRHSWGSPVVCVLELRWPARVCSQTQEQGERLRIERGTLEIMLLVFSLVCAGKWGIGALKKFSCSSSLRIAPLNVWLALQYLQINSVSLLCV